MAVDWARVHSIDWRVNHVDVDTWADCGTLPGVLSAEVERDCDGDAPELESGTLHATGAQGWVFEPGYYRIVANVEQDGRTERVEVATLLFESETSEFNHGRETKAATGRSVLHPAASTRLLAGEHVPRGGDGAQHAARLLRSCIAAPVVVEGSFTLDEAWVFDFDDTALSAAWKVLGAGGFCLQVDGAGRVHVRPLPTVPALELSRANARLLMPGVSRELDWSDVPNRFTAVDDGETATARNETGSDASYDARGYWADEVDDSPKRVNGETLTAYAARRLEELSTVEDRYEYDREWCPDVHPFDVVRGSIEGLSGDLRVVSQEIECSHGLIVRETASKEVRGWRRA